MPPARPTLGQVAALAGVSKATASKVLNGRPRVAPATRSRVEEAIEELGYVPSTGPRATEGTGEIAVVFDTLDNPYSTEMLQGLVRAASGYGVEVMLDLIEPADRADGPLSPAWIRRQATARRKGVLVVTSEITAQQRELLSELAMPVVVIDPVNPLDGGVASVGATNFIGAFEAVQHLMQLGHRRIAFAGGPPTAMPSRERKQGYLSALSAGGTDVPPALVLERSFTFEDGYAMATELLSCDPPPTAIVAGSDMSALGVLEAARQRSLDVPRDLSVVGFDDTRAAASATPPLTTVRQPIDDIGRVALRTLLQLARGEPIDSRHVQLSTQFVVRDSTAAPPSGDRSLAPQAAVTR